MAAALKLSRRMSVSSSSVVAWFGCGVFQLSSREDRGVALWEGGGMTAIVAGMCACVLKAGVEGYVTGCLDTQVLGLI